MEVEQGQPGNDAENVSDGVESLGEPTESANDENQEAVGQESAENGDEHSSKKRPTGWERLKKKTRQQEREIQVDAGQIRTGNYDPVSMATKLAIDGGEA